VSLDNTNILTRANGGSAATTPATITITAHTWLANDAAINDASFGIRADTQGERQRGISPLTWAR
jgi:hypothetical protein